MWPGIRPGTAVLGSGHSTHPGLRFALRPAQIVLAVRRAKATAIDIGFF
jgi:hypothetical protein